MPAAGSVPAWSSCGASIPTRRSKASNGAGRSGSPPRRAVALREFGAATCGARTGRGFALVYLFQRPESMARAAAKAAHELRPGAWLASLEFEIATLQPQLVLESGDGRRVWLYRAPFRQRD